MTTTLGEIAYIHSGVDTATLKELTEASLKLYQAESHGKVVCWIDSASTFLQTAMFSAVRLVIHATLAVFSIFGSMTTNGRQFMKENLIRCVIDLSGIAIGIVGTVSPWTGHDLTAKGIQKLNELFMDHKVIEKKLLEKTVYEAPVWLCLFTHQYSAHMERLAGEAWGGPKKLKHKR